MRPDASHTDEAAPKEASLREADILPHDLQQDIALGTPAYKHRAWGLASRRESKSFVLAFLSWHFQATASIDSAGWFKLQFCKAGTACALAACRSGMAYVVIMFMMVEELPGGTAYLTCQFPDVEHRSSLQLCP